MKDPKTTVRYLGFQTIADGGRRLDFSFSGPDACLHLISVDAAPTLFFGSDHLSIQECAGICYETVKCRLAGWSGTIPSAISLTSADIAEHRKWSKRLGRVTRTPKN
jgi:hypothetical protein